MSYNYKVIYADMFRSHILKTDQYLLKLVYYFNKNNNLNYFNSPKINSLFVKFTNSF